MSSGRHLKILAVAIVAIAATAGAAHAYGDRQYYSSWNYNPSGYYYSTYYYQPYQSYQGYNYHYCIYYPQYPQYVYYYNPHQNYYWGRLDVKGKPGHQYSLLKQDDRKAQLKDISPSAFPEPGKMPPIPESKDNTAMAPIKDLPKLTEGQNLPRAEK